MALEPSTPALGIEDDAELREMQHRFVISATLSIPILILALTALLTTLLGRWLQAALATPVVLYCGWPFLQRGYDSLRNRRLNMFSLIAMGTGIAYVYSIAALLTADTSTPLHFQAAAMIISLVLLGQVLELKARKRSGSAIQALLELSPSKARKIETDGTETDFDATEIRAGDRLRIRPGETIPVDGRVIDGNSDVDESMISGEANPVSKSIDGKLIGGTINGRGSLVMVAEHGSEDGLLARIVAQVAQSQRSRAPVQNLTDRVAAWFVPFVLLIALTTFLTWQFAISDASFPEAMIRTVAVLVVACPCALGLATPMSIMVAMGQAARQGLLFRDAEAIEGLRNIDCLVVDKTGTLTLGQPELSECEVQGSMNRNEILALAASIEQASEHPLATALIVAATRQGLTLRPCQDFRALPGLGVRGQVDGHALLMGNAQLLTAEGVDTTYFDARSIELQECGRTVMILAIDGQAAGLLAVHDPIKPGSANALADLRADGMRIVMLSGDTLKTAAAVARELDITEVHAAALPEEKSRIIEAMQRKNFKVAMAGDGINDAAALAQADIGIAMETGSDIAIESAGLTLVGGDLRGIATARRLSRVTVSNIRQNLALAFGYNILALPLAAGAFLPLFTYTPSPMVAAGAMSLSSVVVILNALRIR